MGAQESPPVRVSAGPVDGVALERLLSLLVDGISAAELETQLAGMQANSLINPATAAAARSLNARLWEAGRREGLLRVLYDTATDLTGIRDVEAVLKAIVRRTRSLIGSDIAYLSLNDYTTGESYIRVKAPSQSADYLTDKTKSHLESSDAAVVAEGVKAIMGVPLRAEGKVIGALVVADRHADSFSREYSAYPPSEVRPVIFPVWHETKSPRRHGSHSKHAPPNQPTPTRWPSVHCVTPSPRVATVPATSCPGVRG